MHPNPPAWCSVVYRSEHKPTFPHEARSTYFSSDPSEKLFVDGVVVLFTSEIVPFWSNVPKPFPLYSSCDCVNSAKYTLSSLYSNRTAAGNEDRSVNAVKVQVRT